MTRSTPLFSWATPLLALRRPSRYRSCSGVGGAGGGGWTRREPCLPARERAGAAGRRDGSLPHRRARRSGACGILYLRAWPMGYTPTMTVPATSRQTRTFEDRAEALAHFFVRAGEAPRLLAFDDAVGCPLQQALAVVEWTAAVGILAEDDLIHAARLASDVAAAVVERRDGDQRVFIYFGPRMDAPPADPYEGTLLYDEPGVRAYIFAQRVHAIA